MPVTKRTAKVVTYKEQDDDDDFVPIVDNSKKNRMDKSNESSKLTTKQPSRKHDEKLSEPSEEEPKMPSEPVIIETADRTSQSTISSDDHQISDADDQDEGLSPKTKRMKQNEENEPQNENEDEEPIKKTAQTFDLPKRNSSIPLGFSTSKIHISSPHVSRVGLSRKSSTIKPLHPNLPSRVLPE